MGGEGFCVVGCRVFGFWYEGLVDGLACSGDMAFMLNNVGPVLKMRFSKIPDSGRCPPLSARPSCSAALCLKGPRT